MRKIYEIAYRAAPEKSLNCLVRFAEVAARNEKEARKIFAGSHAEDDRIVQIRIKRTEVKR